MLLPLLVQLDDLGLQRVHLHVKVAIVSIHLAQVPCQLLLLLVEHFQPLVDDLEIVLQRSLLMRKSRILDGLVQLNVFVKHCDSFVKCVQGLRQEVNMWIFIIYRQMCTCRFVKISCAAFWYCS